MPKLVLYAGTSQAQEFQLKPGKNFVGRGFANDFKLDDASVSTSHALVTMNDAIVTVTDLGSTNGTRINMLPATGNPLQSGQIIRLGAVELMFVADATGSPPPPAVLPPPTAEAAKIATEFFIREPGHVAVSAPPPPPAPVAPAPVPVQVAALKIPAAPAPAPIPVVAAAPAPVRPAGEVRIPTITPVAIPPPAPVAQAPAAIQNLHIISTPTTPPTAAPVPVAPAPVPVQAPALRIPTAPPPASAPAPALVVPTPVASAPMAAPAPVLNIPPPPAPALAPMPVIAAAAPSGSRLSVSGGRTYTAAPTAAPAAPAAGMEEAAAPAVSAEPVDAPPGMVACKFHRTTSGQWLCQKCTQLFCSLCVITRPTPAGTGHFCRACGTQCLPVKIKAVAKKKEKNLVQYSESTILLRTVGFAAGGAILAAGIWTGLAAAIGTDVIFVFSIMVGAICGYAVKIASQDRPGGFFSAMAVVATLIGVVLGKLGAYYATHLNNVTGTVLLTGLVGLVVGLFVAWKLGGGDF